MHGRQLIAGRLLKAEGALVLLERQVETAVRPVDTPEAHIRASQAAPVTDLLEAGGCLGYRAKRLIVAPEHELFVAPLVKQAALGGAGAGRGSNERQRFVAQAVLLGTGFGGSTPGSRRRSMSSCGIADRPRQGRARGCSGGSASLAASAGDEGEAELSQRLRFAARDAEAAEDADRFVQLLPGRVVPEGEVVGEREAAQRLRPFEHAAVRRRAIESLLEELRVQRRHRAPRRRRRASQPSSRTARDEQEALGRRLGRKRVEGGRREREMKTTARDE